jgi:hypothetical protein
MAPKIKSARVRLTDDMGVDTSIEEAAEAMGVSPEDVAAVVDYQRTIREQAQLANLTPLMCLSSCLNLIGEIVSQHTAPDERAELLNACLDHLFANVGIPTDTNVN